MSRFLKFATQYIIIFGVLVSFAFSQLVHTQTAHSETRKGDIERLALTKHTTTGLYYVSIPTNFNAAQEKSYEIYTALIDYLVANNLAYILEVQGPDAMTGSPKLSSSQEFGNLFKAYENSIPSNYSHPDYSPFYTLPDIPNESIAPIIPVTPTLSVIPGEQSVSVWAGNLIFRIINTSGGIMNWTASVTSGSSWLSIADVTAGVNNGTMNEKTIMVRYLQNNNPSPRTAEITVIAPDATGSPKIVTITQAGSTIISPIPIKEPQLAPQTSILSVTPSNKNISATDAGNSGFNVTNIGGGTMNWTASVTSGYSWLSISNGASGVNNELITVQHSQNNNPSPRTAEITVIAPGATGSPKIVTITQEGSAIIYPVPNIPEQKATEHERIRRIEVDRQQQEDQRKIGEQARADEAANEALKRAKNDEEQRIAKEARKRAEDARIAAEQKAQKHQQEEALRKAQEEQKQTEEQRETQAVAEEAERKEQQSTKPRSDFQTQSIPKPNPTPTPNPIPTQTISNTAEKGIEKIKNVFKKKEIEFSIHYPTQESALLWNKDNINFGGRGTPEAVIAIFALNGGWAKEAAISSGGDWIIADVPLKTGDNEYIVIAYKKGYESKRIDLALHRNNLWEKSAEGIKTNTESAKKTVMKISKENAEKVNEVVGDNPALFMKGAICGEMCFNYGSAGVDSISYFAGWTIVSTIPVIDIPADARDLVASIQSGNSVDIGINALALLPLVVSDIPQIGKNVVKFISKYPGKIDELAIGIGKRFPQQAEAIARFILKSDVLLLEHRIKFANKLYSYDLKILNKAGKIIRINPKDIRFTQNSISSKFSNSSTVEATISGLRSGKISPNDFSPIRIFEKEGKTYTLDNRRLYVFKEAGFDISTIRATSQEILKEDWKFTTKNNGESIIIK